MPSFSTRHNVNHSADDMFALVSDVRSYPEFVPLCKGLRVRKQDQLDDGRSVIIADMTIAYKVFRETFTSSVVLDPNARQIDVTYLDGPFKRMENRWRFEATGDATSVVAFSIDYEFRSRTLGAVMGAVFDRAFHHFADAFKARADHVYGVPPRTVAGA